jgi:hypothetical protein
VLVQTIGAWVTIGAVVIGGGWAWWRYNRQKPDLPRVNATVDASLCTADATDYISFSVTITHVSGDALSIYHQPPDDAPKVEVSRLSRISAPGDLPPTTVVVAPVLVRDQTLSGGEFVQDQGMVSIGARLADTVAYQVRFIFRGRWEKQSWMWSPNKILPLPGNVVEIGVGSHVA